MALSVDSKVKELMKNDAASGASGEIRSGI